MSEVLLEWNHLDSALHNATLALDLCRLCGQTDVLTSGYRSLAYIQQALGKEDEALGLVQQARRVASDVSAWYATRTGAWEAHLRLAQGDIAAASRWTQESGLSADDAVSFQLEYEYRTLARVLIAQNRCEEGLELLARILRVEEDAQAWGNVIDALVLQAVALAHQGRSEQALDTLGRALALAEPEGHIRTFVAESAQMRDLLLQSAARGIAVEYVGNLLAEMARELGEARDQPSAMSLPSQSSLLEALSARELEVLRLLRTNLSSSEIAEELFIARSTVRSHIKSIYGKLAVHSRREAVERAQELGLL
jgi:LuxR family maltose regulon positive regulatory protein